MFDIGSEHALVMTQKNAKKFTFKKVADRGL